MKLAQEFASISEKVAMRCRHDLELDPSGISFQGEHRLRVPARMKLTLNPAVIG